MPVDLPSPRVIARTDDRVLQEGRYGPRMVLTARWSEAAARAWASRGARELELNYAKGWERGDLGFLTELRFDRLPHLEDCALEWRPRARSLFRHTGVKNLFISRLDAGGDFWPFRDMTGLRALALKNVRLSILDGIEDGPELEFLEIGLARKLSRLDGLESQTGLTWLELSTEEGDWWRWRARRELEERLFGATAACEGP